MLVVGVDLETTGLSYADGHRIVEFALIGKLYDPQTHVAQDKFKFVRRVNPQRPIDPKAQNVHGITFEMVANEPTFDTFAHQIVGVLKLADLLIAHNGVGFDMPFLRHELALVGKEMPDKPVIDTMLDARWATFWGKFPNLGELCFACGEDYDPSKAHAADYDVDRMLGCFFKGRRQGFFLNPVFGSNSKYSIGTEPSGEPESGSANDEQPAVQDAA
jgi:DNA polymerase III subunit epsilon